MACCADEYPFHDVFDEKKNDQLRSDFLKRMEDGAFDKRPNAKGGWFFTKKFIVEHFWDFIANGEPTSYRNTDKCWWYCNECGQQLL